MAKLYLFGILAFVFAVCVAEKGTYQKDDAAIEEGIDKLAKALEEPVKRTKVGNETSDATDIDDDEENDGDLDSDTDGDDEDLGHLVTCMGKCGADDLCDCENAECVPEECLDEREVEDEYRDSDGDLDEQVDENKNLP